MEGYLGWVYQRSYKTTQNYQQLQLTSQEKMIDTAGFTCNVSTSIRVTSSDIASTFSLIRLFEPEASQQWSGRKQCFISGKLPIFYLYFFLFIQYYFFNTDEEKIKKVKAQYYRILMWYSQKFSVLLLMPSQTFLRIKKNTVQTRAKNRALGKPSRN